MIWVPNQGLVQQSQLAIHGRNLPSTNDDDSNFEVDYNEESPNEDGSSILESTALSSDENIIQNNNPAISQDNPPTTVVQAKHENKGNGKAEVDPDPRLVMGTGATTIARRSACLDAENHDGHSSHETNKAAHITVTPNTTTSGIRRGRVRL